MMHSNPIGLDRAIPVQLLSGRVLYAEHADIIVAQGFRLATDNKGRIRRAFQIAAIPSLYHSSAGDAYEHPLECGRKVWTLTGTPGARR